MVYRHHRELIVLQRDLKQRLTRNADAPGMYRAIQNKADEVAAEIKVRGYMILSGDMALRATRLRDRC